jgi:VanZ family protein
MPPKLRVWLPVAAMMCITLLFGSDLFSHRRTHELLWTVLSWFGLDGLRLPRSRLAVGEGWLRKSAHFIEYGLLAALWLRALRWPGAVPWRWSWAVVALVGTTLWACVDEAQQAFVAVERTGSWHDVLLDASGAATALTLCGLWGWWSRPCSTPHMLGPEKPFTDP